MRPAAIACAAALAAAASAASAAPAPLTEPEVRAFAAGQVRALNAGDLDGYFAGFAPRAVFTSQALGSDNAIVPYGTSTVPQARAQLARTLARSKVAETVQVRKVFLGPRRTGGALSAHVRTRIETGGRTRLSCAERLMTFARAGGRLRTLSQTDTLVRCRTAE